MNSTEPLIRRGRPQTRNRTQLLETAMQAYWQDDRAGTSVNAICGFAGVSKPSLYREFGNEDGLTLAVLDQYEQSVLRPMLSGLDAPGSMDDKLAAMTDFVSEAQMFATGCLYVKMRSTRSRFGPMTQARIADIEAVTLGRYTRWLEDCHAGAELRADLASALAARYLFNQLSLATQLRAGGLDTTQVRALLELALSALRA